MSFAELRGQDTSLPPAQAGTAQLSGDTGRARTPSPGAICTPWAHLMDSTQRSCSSAWGRNPTFYRQGEILLCFLCGGFSHGIPPAGTVAFGGKWRMAGPSSQAQRQVPNDLPLQTAFFASSSAFAEAPAQKLMNGCSRKLFLPAVGSSYFAFNCAFTCLSLITVAAVEKCSFMNNKCSFGKKPPLCFGYQKPPDPLLSALQSLVFTNTFSILLNNDNSSVFTSLNYHILWKELIK